MDLTKNTSKIPHDQAITYIQQDMYAKTQPNKPGFRMKEQCHIQRYYKPGMQGVKADAAAVWIIEGIGQQVIHVNY